MCSYPGRISIRIKGKEENDSLVGTSSHVHNDSTVQTSINLSSSSSPSLSSSSGDVDEAPRTEDNKQGPSNENLSRELVLYDPVANGTGPAGPSEPVLEPVAYQPPPPNIPKILPSIGAFTVQCANCFKWRLIPTKEKYEEIREHILEQPFYCKTAQEWRPDISCEDPADIKQDGSRLWAIDKPNISQPPPGWQRLLRIRGEGSSKFADVYYVAPSGKRLRSMVEIQKFLLEHPEYMNDGVTMAQFSFQIPKPLQENYVRKRPPRLAACDGIKSVEPGEVNPLAWAGPDDPTGLCLGRPALPPPPQYFEAPLFDHLSQPPRKQAKRFRSKETSNSYPPNHSQQSNAR